MNKYYEILEFNIILGELKEKLILDANKKELEKIEPFSEIEAIEEALSEVDEATTLILRLGKVPFYFHSDIAFLLAKTNKNGVLQIDELLEIEKFLDTVKGIPIYIQSLEVNNIPYQYLQMATTSLEYPKQLNLRIKEIISPFGTIADNASSALKDIRRKIKDTEKNIQSKLQSIMSTNANKLTQSVISIRNDRYVLPVKNDYKNVIKGIIHDQSSSGETVFIEPLAVCELNNTLNSYLEKEKKEIYNILRDISEEIGQHYDILSIDYQIIKHLDLVFAKAEYAIAIDGSKPKINNKGYLKLYRCKHPLLRVANVVTNDVVIGDGYQGIIITGPNTGGKTVLMKTVGLLAIMIKFGLLIPCSKESDMMIFDEVFADIGDDQSIAQNLSTFSAHLTNIIEIINNVTSKSLVLLDELGSGTDPLEGASLGIATFDYLINKDCIVIASSHYSELKIHAFESEKIINASVEFDIKTLRPTYKLLLGVPGASNAINISKILGLHQEIIARALNNIATNKSELTTKLTKLTNQSQELKKQLASAYQKNQELQALRDELLLEKKQMIEERNKIIEEANLQAKKIVSNAMKKIDDLLQQLNEMMQRDVKQHELAQLKYDIRSLKEEGEDSLLVESDDEINVGDQVFITSYKCYGIIIKIKKNNKYDVQIGNAIVTVGKNVLQKTNHKEPQKIIPKSNIKVEIKQQSVSARLDLRGEKYEDAYEMLDKYLDDAFYSGLHQVTIIHGFGTGVIREMVQKTLPKRSFIDSFRYGGENEGGQGVTVVTFKQ